ncbi:Alpha/Beta hydrolase protein [Aspergillus pseudocaelatus]|uniref:Alpha/Beta hydrolase protein n=1 Tax=Aspergillus pseudocaelatus TaxID=1825620 RepID=A0ABQ6W122_9EURO|nr:Alpha/Beta hydrolase protein [Aspergillus pseudocaelatus]
MSNKPIIIIVHGGWQGPHQYQPLRDGLDKRGFVVLQPANPSTGVDRAAIAGKSPYDDAQNIRAQIEPYLAAGKEIVMVCHSYGGIPGTLSLEGYQTTDRQAKGLSGGVKRIIYISSFALPQQNMSAFDMLGRAWPPSMERADDVVTVLDGSAFDDVDEKTLASLMETLAYQSTASAETAVHFVGFCLSIPKTYITCLQDHIVPIEAQTAMVEALGANTTVEKLDCGHIPFLKPDFREELFDMIERAALS